MLTLQVCIPPITRKLRFGLLPLLDIANGHSFFVQQLQLQFAHWPYAVHATYQYSDESDCAFGKRERLREWGLWLADAAEGALPNQDGTNPEAACATAHDGTPAGSTARADDTPEQRYLVLSDPTPLPAAAEWVGQADPHVRGRQHVEYLNAFRRRLAAGVALAKALNRTVVLPPFHCYCDKYWARLMRGTL
eukprot:2632670-Prymnesium_polylepis.1